MEKAKLFEYLMGFGPTVISVAGAGGKSSLLQGLALMYPDRTVLTTSTHLARSQAALAQIHIELTAGEAVNANCLRGHESFIVTGPPDEQGKWTSPGEKQLEEIRKACSTLGKTLVIEADGSKGLPIKAPAAHEPVIPSYTEICVYVLGLSAVLKPLSDKTAHRHNIVSEVSGLAVGEEISIQTLKSLFQSDQGGLKAVPQGAKAVAVLNQADACEISQAEILNGIRGLDQAGYDYIWTGSLQTGPLCKKQSAAPNDG